MGPHDSSADPDFDYRIRPAAEAGIRSADGFS
jgi:hypothetical protein